MVSGRGLLPWSFTEVTVTGRQQADGDSRWAGVDIEPERDPGEDDDQHAGNVELNDEVADVAHQHEPNLEARERTYTPTTSITYSAKQLYCTPISLSILSFDRTSLWNSLPLTVRDSSLTLTQFCTRLKTVLFTRAYRIAPP